jgi:hypothetical protein
MSTDPLQAALGGDQPEPSGGGDGGNAPGAADHPILTRFGGDVQKALDAYQQLDAEYGRQGDRLGKQVQSLESQLAQIQAAQEQYQQMPEQDENIDMPLDQLQEWFDQNPAQATAYLIAQGQQMVLDQLDTKLNERLAPLEVNVGRTTASTLVEGLKSDLGNDMVARNAEVLVELQKTDPGFFKGDPAVVFSRMRTAVLAAEHQRAPRGASNGATTQSVEVEGGSSGRNLQSGGGEDDEAAEFKAAMLERAGTLDIFGNTKTA